MSEQVAQQAAPEAPKTETKTEGVVEHQQEVVKPNPKEELYSSKFAHISRKERELLAKEKEIKAHAKELEKFKSLKGSAKEKVADALAELGLTVDDVVQYQLSQFDQQDEDSSPEGKYKILEKKIAKIEQEKLEQQELTQKESEKAEQKYIDEQISNFKNQIVAFIEERTEDYELIAAQEAQETVFEVVEEFFNQTGQVMTIEEAASKVEAYLEEEAKAILTKTKKLKKFAQVGDESPESAVKDNSPSQHKSDVAPTLSNSIVNNSTVVDQSDRLLSREESLARVAAKLKWNK